MKNKKFLLGLMVMFVLGFVLVACGGQEETGNDGGETDAPVEQEPNDTENGNDEQPTEPTGEMAINAPGWPSLDEPVTMTIMAPGTAVGDWPNMPIFRYATAQTNIHFEFNTPPMDDFETVFSLALASGDVGDILFGLGASRLTRAMEIELGTQGLLIPLEDLIANYAPNLSALLDAYPDVRQNITAPDGHIYTLPFLQRGDNALWAVGPMWYNGTWLEELGADVPETLDEFTDLMFAFRDAELAGPGVPVFPLSDNGMPWIRSYLAGAFGMVDSGQNAGIQVIDGVVRHNAMTENYRAYLEYMAMLFEEGIINPEVYTIARDSHTALVRNNQVGIFQDWFSFFSTGSTEVEAVTDPMFRPLASEWDNTPMIRASARMATGAFAITSSNPNPAAAIAFIDFFYSDEGSEILARGPEGYLWVYAENDAGEQVKIFAQDFENPEEFRGSISPDFGLTSPRVVREFPPIVQDANEVPDTTFNDFIREETIRNFEPFGVVPFPLAGLTLEEAAETSIIEADLNSFLQEMEAQFISGQRPINDDTWAELQATLETFRAPRLVEIYQVVYDRWSSSGQ